MSFFLLLFICGIWGNLKSEKSGSLTSATAFMTTWIRGAKMEPRTAEPKATAMIRGLTAPSTRSAVILNNASHDNQTCKAE